MKGRINMFFSPIRHKSTTTMQSISCVSNRKPLLTVLPDKFPEVHFFLGLQAIRYKATRHCCQDESHHPPTFNQGWLYSMSSSQRCSKCHRIKSSKVVVDGKPGSHGASCWVVLQKAPPHQKFKTRGPFCIWYFVEKVWWTRCSIRWTIRCGSTTLQRAQADFSSSSHPLSKQTL